MESSEAVTRPQEQTEQGLKMINTVVTYFSDPDPEGRSKRLGKRSHRRDPYTDYYYV